MKRESIAKIVDNYGIAFFLFYLIFPFIAKGFRNRLIPMLPIVILFFIYSYWIWHIYSYFGEQMKLFRHSVLMSIGIFPLYVLEVLYFEEFQGYHMAIYMVLSLTYLPMALEMEKFRRDLKNGFGLAGEEKPQEEIAGEGNGSA